MAQSMLKSRLVNGVSACMLCVVPGLTAFAQDLNRPPAPGTWAVSSAERAGFLLEFYEYVVAGEFVDFPEEAAADLTRSGPREVVMPFAVSGV